jgi:hypothetical protein
MRAAGSHDSHHELPKLKEIDLWAYPLANHSPLLKNWYDVVALAVYKADVL